MDDKQFRTLMDAVYKLGMRVEELHLRLNKIQELQDVRWQILYSAISDEDEQMPLEGMPEPIDIPPDLRKFFPDDES